MKGKMPHNLHDYGNKPADYGSVTSNRAGIFENRVGALLENLEKQALVEEEAQLLDVGASIGTFIHIARSNGLNAYGVEPSMHGSVSARSNGLIVPQGKAEALPYKNEVFDIVHAHHVFEHLEDPFIAAKEVLRVLKPGGLLFIEVPNQFDNIMFRRDIWLKRVPQRQRNIRSIHHLWFFSRKTVRKLLEQAGFTEIKVYDTYGWPPKGWRAPFTILTRIIGYFFFGGYFLSAYGFKSREV
jgi:SAM-dependent methyltransferase